MMFKRQLVCYHDKCIDGTAAAAAHSMATNGAVQRPDCDYTYQPINYDTKTPEGFDGFLERNEIGEFESVWFLDFCPKNEILKYLTDQGKQVIIIDHHTTALEALDEFSSDLLTYVLSYDNKLSGAGLTRLLRMGLDTLDLLKPVEAHQVEVQVNGQTCTLLTNIKLDLMYEELDDFYNLIRVRDVWDESDPNRKHLADLIHQYLVHHGCYEIEAFKQFLKQFEAADDPIKFLEETMDKAQLIDDVIRNQVENALALGYKTKVDAKNLKNINVFIGSVPWKLDTMAGDIWSKRFPDEPAIMIGLTYNHDKNGIAAGLRSNHLIECVHLAKFFDGGGHKQASGCNMTFLLKELPCNPEAINTFLINLIKDIY